MLPQIIIICTNLLLLATAGSIGYNGTETAEDGKKPYLTTRDDSYSSTTIQVNNAASTEVNNVAPTEVHYTAPTEVDNSTPAEVDNTTPTEVDNTTPTEVDNTTPTEVGNAATTKVDNKTPTKVDNTTPTEVDNTTPTEVGNTTPAEVDNATPTDVGNAAMTKVDNTTPSEVDNTTPTEVDNTTPTEVGNAATTKVNNKTPTEVGNATPTQVGNAATTKVDNTTPTEVGNAATTESPKKCNSDEFQCADGACVPAKQQCDGDFNCEDGSDEKTADCSEEERQMMGLLMHCMEDRNNLKHGVCPDICKTETDYCSYALLAAQKSKPMGVCRLPDFPINGHYTVHKLETSASNFSDFSLRFKCNEKTELVGEAILECVNGEWNHNNSAKCSDTCKLKLMRPKYEYKCKRDGRKNDICGEYVAIGTEVVVEKLDRKISNSTIKTSATCTENLRLRVNREDCIGDVDKRQQDFEKDVMSKLTDFEDKFQKVSHPSLAFEELVSKYRSFESYVNGNTTELKIQIAVCDMNLDLMKSNAEEPREEN